MDADAATQELEFVVQAMRKHPAFKDTKVERWVDVTSPQAVLWIEVERPEKKGSFTLVRYEGLPISEAIQSENARVAAAFTMGLTQVESVEQKWARLQARINELEDEKKALTLSKESLQARVAKLEERLEQGH